jgi:hypothetical protein
MLPVALSLLLLASAPVAAESGPHSGSYGVHLLIDHDGRHAGVRCAYDLVSARYRLKSFRIRPPIVFAVDRTRRVDYQTVKWKFVIEERKEAGGPAEVTTRDIFVSGYQSATASDQVAARFQSRTWKLPAGTPDEGQRYRVWIRMYWFSPSGKISGKAFHQASAYSTPDSRAYPWNPECNRSIGL